MSPYLAVPDRAQRQVFGFSLFVAPLLLGLSTFWWRDYGVGIVGGTLQVVSGVFWIVALLGLAELARPRWRRGALLMSVVVIYAGVALTNFGLEGIFGEAIRNSGNGVSRLELRGALGPSIFVVMLLPGLLFPLSIMIFGVLLWRLKAIRAWCMIVLGLGGLSFPAGRIPRIETVAHASDLLLLLGLSLVGWRYLQAQGDTGSSGVERGTS